MICKVCSHPNRKEIESLLKTGMGVVRIATHLRAKKAATKGVFDSVSKNTLNGHRKDCMGMPVGGLTPPPKPPLPVVPGTIEARRQYLEDEAFKLLQDGNSDKDRTSLIKCASDMLEKRAREECFCDRIGEHPEVQEIVKRYEEALARMASNLCPPCATKSRSKEI